jgi:hypothetical protein
LIGRSLEDFKLDRGTVMTFQEEIDALKSRIAKAEFERDTWGAAGRQEKYVAAYFLVEGLQLQLDQRLGQPIAEHARG